MARTIERAQHGFVRITGERVQIPPEESELNRFREGHPLDHNESAVVASMQMHRSGSLELPAHGFRQILSMHDTNSSSPAVLAEPFRDDIPAIPWAADNLRFI